MHHCPLYSRAWHTPQLSDFYISESAILVPAGKSGLDCLVSEVSFKPDDTLCIHPSRKTHILRSREREEEKTVWHPTVCACLSLCVCLFVCLPACLGPNHIHRSGNVGLCPPIPLTNHKTPERTRSFSDSAFSIVISRTF